MNVEHKEIDLIPLKNALKGLLVALEIKNPSDLERDGTIQRFEFTVELSWKMMKRYLALQGRSELSGSPKPILRDALQEGLIDDIAGWFFFIDKHNLVSHVYSEEQANLVYDALKDFPEYAKKLIQKIEEKI